MELEVDDLEMDLKNDQHSNLNWWPSRPLQILLHSLIPQIMILLLMSSIFPLLMRSIYMLMIIPFRRKAEVGTPLLIVPFELGNLFFSLRKRVNFSFFGPKAFHDRLTAGEQLSL